MTEQFNIEQKNADANSEQVGKSVDNSEKAGVSFVGIFMDAAGDLPQNLTKTELELNIPSILL